MKDPAELVPIIERWGALDAGAEVSARSVEEAAAILPYSDPSDAEPHPGTTKAGRHAA